MYSEKIHNPAHFYWIKKSYIRDMWNESKSNTIAKISIYFILATICMIGYYLLYPIKLFHDTCDKWCDN